MERLVPLLARFALCCILTENSRACPVLQFRPPSKGDNPDYLTRNGGALFKCLLHDGYRIMALRPARTNGGKAYWS